MSSSWIQPSPFWTAVRRLFSVKFLVTLVIMAIVAEGLARLSPIIVTRNVHQPYLVSVRPCEIECTNQGQWLSWRANERGTRGDLYHGQPIRIAAIGSSTTASSMLDQGETWPEQVKTALGPARVHIDNYAREGATYREATRILEYLGRQGPKYDVLLVMMHLSTRDAQESGDQDRNAFHFWGQWVLPRDAPIVSPGLLRQRMAAQLRAEPRTRAFWLGLRSLVTPNPGPAGSDPALSRSNRELRNSGQVDLVDVDVSFSDAEIADLQAQADGLIAAARSTGAKVYMILQPVAFDENEVPEVAARWFSLYAVDGRAGSYMSNRSIATGVRSVNRIMADRAEAEGVEVIDLDGLIRPTLRQRGDLFDDKWHFAPRGAALAGEILADAIRLDFPELSGPGIHPALQKRSANLDPR